MRAAILAPAAAFLAALAVAAPAAAQGVDFYQHRQLEKRVEELESMTDRLRNAVQGGESIMRFDEFEAEIGRLTGAIEELRFALDQHKAETTRKLEDLEFRIIQLEGGDGGALFETGPAEGAAEQSPAPAPEPAPQAAAPSATGPVVSGTVVEGTGETLSPEQKGTVGVLGQIRSEPGAAAPRRPEVPPDEQAAYDAGFSAFISARYDVARDALERFVASHPDSQLAGQGFHWLGETYVALGDDQTAARRFLDAATLYPRAPTAPESLLSLGAALNRMGQSKVACSTLREVRNRFPGALETVRKAEAEAARAGCG